jgi:hypothetical protein
MHAARVLIRSDLVLMVGCFIVELWIATSVPFL